MSDLEIDDRSELKVGDRVELTEINTKPGWGSKGDQGVITRISYGVYQIRFDNGEDWWARKSILRLIK